MLHMTQKNLVWKTFSSPDTYSLVDWWVVNHSPENPSHSYLQIKGPNLKLLKDFWSLLDWIEASLKGTGFKLQKQKKYFPFGFPVITFWLNWMPTQALPVCEWEYLFNIISFSLTGSQTLGEYEFLWYPKCKHYLVSLPCTHKPYKLALHFTLV